MGKPLPPIEAMESESLLNYESAVTTRWVQSIPKAEGYFCGHVLDAGAAFGHPGMTSCRHGYGSNIYTTGKQYRGSFIADKKNGFGQQLYGNLGDKYTGEWKNGHPHGMGYFQYASGASYSGEFYNGKRYGEGEYRFANGKVYSGQWINGKFDGFGLLRRENGTVAYQGEYRCGLAHGEGTYFDRCGHKYLGSFINGKFHGKGKLYLSDGRVFVGMFSNDSLCGKGTMFYSDRTASGTFRRCHIHGVQFPRPWAADGEIIFHSTGERVVCSFRDGIPHGEAVRHLPNKIIHGTYHHGEFTATKEIDTSPEKKSLVLSPEWM